MGFGVSASSSRTRGSGNSDDTTWTASHVSSGNTATLISGGNANIIGSQVAGNKVVANIGGDLHIQSLQDTSDAHSSTHTKGGSISAGVSASGLLTPGGSYNQSKANADGHYASVNEYAGIMAGAGGFDVTVGGNTDLQGAIIASTQEAVDNHRNRLTTGSITTSDIANESRFDAKGSSVGIGSSGGGSMGASKDSGYESSTTIAGVSGGNITITNEAAQQLRTGQTAEEAIASTNRNVLTGQDTNSLSKDWDVNELVDRMKAETEITAAFSGQLQQTGQNYIQGRLLEAKRLREEADKLQASDPNGAQALRDQAAGIEAQWGAGGNGRLILSAHTSAVGGNLQGSIADVLQDTTVNVLQGLAAREVKEITNNYFAGNDEARAAMQAIVACAGAAAKSAECGSGALGAAGSVVIGGLINAVMGVKGSTLSESEKQRRIDLITNIMAGITNAMGGDAAVADAAARLEAENNEFQSRAEAWEAMDEKDPAAPLIQGAQTIRDGAATIVKIGDGLFEIVWDEATDPLNYVPFAAVISRGGKLFRVLGRVPESSGSGVIVREISHIAPGKLTGSLDSLTSAERKFVQEQLTGGNNVRIIDTGSRRTPDFEIGGIRYELKTVSGVANTTEDGLSAAISSRILDGRGQSGHIIVDAREQAGMTVDAADRAARRAFGNDPNHKIQSISIITPEGTYYVPRK